MRAILCKDLGGADKPTINEVRSPVVSRNQAKIRVKVVALNFFDTLIIRGKCQIKPGLHFSHSGGVMGLFAKATSIRIAVKPSLLPIMKMPWWHSRRVAPGASWC